MTEIIDAIRNMPPSAADVLLLALVGLGAGMLILAGGIWASYRDAAKGDPTKPTERRSERRKNRDRPQP